MLLQEQRQSGVRRPSLRSWQEMVGDVMVVVVVVVQKKYVVDRRQGSSCGGAREVGARHARDASQQCGNASNISKVSISLILASSYS
jgi:hypothetical protein